MTTGKYLRTEEHRNKISWALKGIKRHPISEEHKRKISIALLGKKASEETKLKMSVGRLREKNNMWKGGKIFDKDKYVMILNPKHPNSNKAGYIYEHKLVMEKKLGRNLNKGEKVHHIDFNHSNNNPNNLFLFKNEGEHKKYHLNILK